jgi:Asp/Glu/hydantoin racemase
VKIILVNVNTSESMTAVIAAGARKYASPGTQTVALRPFFGPEAVDCNFESYLSAVGVMGRVLAYDEPYDAVVLAGFGEHGRDGLQDRAEAICLGCAGMAGLAETINAELGVPVVDGICAAVRLAEAVVGLCLKTSKLRTYAAPEPKVISGWPLSQPAGSRS